MAHQYKRLPNFNTKMMGKLESFIAKDYEYFLLLLYFRILTGFHLKDFTLLFKMQEKECIVYLQPL